MIATIVTLLGSILIILGVVLIAIATFGLLTLPDFYARMHMPGKPDTLGGILLLGGLALHAGFNLTALKLIFILLFICLTNPVAAHLLARAAMKSGLQPWHREDEA